MTLLSGALLGILEESGLAIMTLTEGVEPEDFFKSRLTQQEVRRHMHIMADTVANVPDEVKRTMIEIDWPGWVILRTQLLSMECSGNDALWFGVRSLVPATLMWLRFYRNKIPTLFSLAE